MGYKREQTDGKESATAARPPKPPAFVKRPDGPMLDSYVSTAKFEDMSQGVRKAFANVPREDDTDSSNSSSKGSAKRARDLAKTRLMKLKQRPDLVGGIKEEVDPDSDGGGGTDRVAREAGADDRKYGSNAWKPLLTAQGGVFLCGENQQTTS